MRIRTTRRVAAVTGIAALAFAGAAGTTAQAATATLTYDCTALGSIPVGQWTVDVTVDLPEKVTVGEAVPAPSITAKVTTSEDAANLMRSVLQADRVEGTGAMDYDIDGEQLEGSLTVPDTKVPDTGPIVVDATGEGASATAPSQPTTSTVTAGDFTADLTVTNDAGSTQQVNVACTLAPDTDATIGTIDVVDAPTEPTTEPTEEPTTEPTEEPTTAPTDAPSGPPVETGVATDGTNAETIALGLMAVGGVAAATAATRRRLND